MRQMCGCARFVCIYTLSGLAFCIQCVLRQPV
ncbi:hypothetical protein M2994_27805 [Klebsiella pneumoniae]|nr:hypothetical protein [Klebsiella pneumoniae]